MGHAWGTLTREEQTFCKFYLALGTTDPAEAYRKAFPEDCKGTKLNKYARPKGEKMLLRPEIKESLEWLKLPAKEQSADVLKDQLSSIDPKMAQAAAKAVIDQNEAKQFENAVKRWASIMSEIGAEIVIPMGKDEEIVRPFSEMFKA